MGEWIVKAGELHSELSESQAQVESLSGRSEHLAVRLQGTSRESERWRLKCGEAELKLAEAFEVCPQCGRGKAQHLYREGDLEAARSHFREAHRLQPDNWTYKRQAWSIEPSALDGPMARFWQGPLPGSEGDWAYDGDWVADAKAGGPSNYYPRFRP